MVAVLHFHLVQSLLVIFCYLSEEWICSICLHKRRSSMENLEYIPAHGKPEVYGGKRKAGALCSWYENEQPMRVLRDHSLFLSLPVPSWAVWFSACIEKRIEGAQRRRLDGM